MTGRAAVLALVFVVLALSFAYPLRGWFDQRAQISELRERTTAQERKLTELSSEVQRWDDPAFVETVARERLRFVMPGEASFVVLGGDEAGGQTDLESTDGSGDWWEQLWTTVQEADRPPADASAAAGAPAAGTGGEATPDAAATTGPSDAEPGATDVEPSDGSILGPSDGAAAPSP